MAIFQCGTYSANQFGTSIAFSGARTIVLFSGQPWYHHSLGSQRADRRVAFYKKKTESCHEQYLGIVTQDEDPVIASAICFPSFCLVHSPGELIRRGVHKVLKPLLMTSLRDGYRYQIGWSFGKNSKRPLTQSPSFLENYVAKFLLRIWLHICKEVWGPDSMKYMHMPSSKCVLFWFFFIQLLKKHTLNPDFTLLVSISCSKSPVSSSQNLPHKFLDWKWPHPPLALFQKFIRFGSGTLP